MCTGTREIHWIHVQSYQLTGRFGVPYFARQFGGLATRHSLRSHRIVKLQLGFICQGLRRRDKIRPGRNRDKGIPEKYMLWWVLGMQQRHRGILDVLFRVISVNPETP